MKFKLWNPIYWSATLALIFFVTLAPLQTLQASPSEHSDKSHSGGTALVGTWRVQVQQYNCQTEAPLGNPFSSLLTFSTGGTMLGSTSNAAFAVGQRGTDEGVWSFVGHHRYQAKSIVFLLFTTPALPPASPGFMAGTQTISQEIEFKNGRDEFSSEAKIDFADTTGTVYRSGCAWATGQRFE